MRDKDEEAMRAAVSRLWGVDWDSTENAAYDTWTEPEPLVSGRCPASGRAFIDRMLTRDGPYAVCGLCDCHAECGVPLQAGVANMTRTRYSLPMAQTTIKEYLDAAEAAERYGISSADAARARLRRAIANNPALADEQPRVLALPGGGTRHTWPTWVWQMVAEPRPPRYYEQRRGSRSN